MWNAEAALEKEQSRLEGAVVDAACKYAAEHAWYMASDGSAEPYCRMLSAQHTLLEAVHNLQQHIGGE